MDWYRMLHNHRVMNTVPWKQQSQLNQRSVSLSFILVLLNHTAYWMLPEGLAGLLLGLKIDSFICKTFFRILKLFSELLIM